jgi:hypothetical protein
MCKIGDIVGVLLEFNGGTASLSYFKNKVIIIDNLNNRYLLEEHLITFQLQLIIQQHDYTMVKFN